MKKINLLIITSAVLVLPSCGRLVLRKVASQLVATYKQFNINQDTIDMVKNVRMNWNYEKTEESALNDAKTLLAQLTGEENPEKKGSLELAKEKYNFFFEQTDSIKKYSTDYIKWNLFASTADTFEPVFDVYFPEDANCKYSTKADDLYIEGSIFNKINDEVKEVGSGAFHYDNYGRLLNENLTINYQGDTGKINISFNVNASYNPVKENA